MLVLGKEAARLAQLPTNERLQGLKRIIPWGCIKAMLKHGPALGTHMYIVTHLPTRQMA